MSVRIIPNDKGNPAGKLADAEVIFEAEAEGLEWARPNAIELFLIVNVPLRKD